MHMGFLITPELDTVSIVLRGTFNPAIFSPYWFEKYELIASKAEDADIQLIHPEVVSFKTDWLSLNSDKNSFSVETSEAPWVRCLDLVEQTFGDLLSHTPIFQLGINRKIEIPSTMEKNEAVGNLLAPKKPWGEWASSISSGTDENHGGMRNVTMEIRNLEDREKGYVRASVSPAEGSHGVVVFINDHYEFLDVLSDSTLGSTQAMKSLSQNFTTSLDRSESITNQIMKLIDEA